MDVWNSERVSNDRASYARLMALCALSSHRIQSGSSCPDSKGDEHVNPGNFLVDALAAIPTNLGELAEFKMMQAIGLVCMVALECCDATLLQRFLGIYHAAVADQGFCDERRWPSIMSSVEREERRRLYWHMYRLEVHTSLVQGHVLRCPELQSAVSYPSLEDEIH